MKWPAVYLCDFAYGKRFDVSYAILGFGILLLFIEYLYIWHWGSYVVAPVVAFCQLRGCPNTNEATLNDTGKWIT